MTTPVRSLKFPATAHGAFLAHAAVAPLTAAAAEAVQRCVESGSLGSQESPEVRDMVARTREDAARLIGATPDEISLLGPTAAGISMVARGLSWQAGDEVVYYADDYPSNAYPWMALAKLGVKAVALQPEAPGVITWEVLEDALTARTRLVALATCHFLSGYRIDVDAIGRRLQEQGILFSIDGIQTLGAFPISVQHVDFLSAGAHKWLLGPCGAGIFYVKASRRALLEPLLVGAVNVRCPDFVTQNAVDFVDGSARYEPGALNLPGICGMGASLRLLLDEGVAQIAARILALRALLLREVRARGHELYLESWDQRPEASDAERSGIASVFRRNTDLGAVFARLQAAGITTSLRRTRSGQQLIRFSPHFYNTEEEILRAVEQMD